MIKHVLFVAATAFTIALGSGCAQYQVPGGGADFRALGITQDEQDALSTDTIAQELARRPAASFPAVIATVRVQDQGYRSYSNRGYNLGDVSIVTLRDVEEEGDLEGFTDLPMVRAVVPLNRLVFGEVNDEIDLRTAASRVHADMLLLYTFDTSFRVKTTVPALGVFTLGLFPSEQARVSATASAVLLDTRTGFIYALAESSASAKQAANGWTSSDAVEDSRLRAEREAFEGMLAELRTAWSGVVEGYAGGAGGD